MIVKCAPCGADPYARWREPPMLIFIDGRRSTDGYQYECRDHLSQKRETEITVREKALGLKTGELR
jgi:hypothetical protein